MRALLVTPHGVAYTTERPVPQAGPGEALVRVRLAGVCATDLQVISGYNDFDGVLGHEFVGEIAAAEDARWQGQRVVGRLNVGCGECEWCRGEVPEHCVARQAVGIRGRDGVFADFVALPMENLVPVPESVPDEVAVFTEPLAAALRIVEQIKIGAGMRAAVVGPGRLGLLCAQVLADAGADVQVYGRREASLALPISLGISAALSESAPAEAFDIVVDCSGSPSGLNAALQMVRSMGTVLLKSSQLADVTFNLNEVVVREITLLGSRCGPFKPALELLAAERIAVRPLISRRFPLPQGRAALQYASQPGVRKVLLEIAGVGR